jgi:hypothetical protein
MLPLELGSTGIGDAVLDLLQIRIRRPGGDDQAEHLKAKHGTAHLIQVSAGLSERAEPVEASRRDPVHRPSVYRLSAHPSVEMS